MNLKGWLALMGARSLSAMSAPKQSRVTDVFVNNDA